MKTYIFAICIGVALKQMVSSCPLESSPITKNETSGTIDGYDGNDEICEWWLEQPQGSTDLKRVELNISRISCSGTSFEIDGDKKFCSLGNYVYILNDCSVLCSTNCKKIQNYPLKIRYHGKPKGDGFSLTYEFKPCVNSTSASPPTRSASTAQGVGLSENTTDSEFSRGLVTSDFIISATSLSGFAMSDFTTESTSNEQNVEATKQTVLTTSKEPPPPASGNNNQLVAVFVPIVVILILAIIGLLIVVYIRRRKSAVTSSTNAPVQENAAYEPITDVHGSETIAIGNPAYQTVLNENTESQYATIDDNVAYYSTVADSARVIESGENDPPDASQNDTFDDDDDSFRVEYDEVAGERGKQNDGESEVVQNVLYGQN